MEFIFEQAASVDGFAAFASAGGVTALDHEAGNQAVEDGVIVVAIEAELEEVAGREGGLFGEEFEEDVACGGGEKDLSGGLRLEIVERTHCEEIPWEEVVRQQCAQRNILEEPVGSRIALGLVLQMIN